VNPEQTGFAEFYQASRDSCLRAVTASTGDCDAAEDLVAEAFARAWAAWRTVGRHPAPQAWVVRTALNESVSRWRRRRREEPLPGGALAPWRPAGTPVAGGSVDGAVMTVLRRLPARQREVIALRVFLDLDTAQTARALGIAPGTVTAHLARAVATLRAELSPLSTTPPARRRSPSERPGPHGHDGRALRRPAHDHPG
jgi:RNA polymerase sigma-70 factor (ECF subfamily)